VGAFGQRNAIETDHVATGAQQVFDDVERNEAGAPVMRMAMRGLQAGGSGCAT
jgi:hypothetical protein